MGFVEGAQDCTSCHKGHENLGQGKCVLCHVDRTPGVNVDEAGRTVFRFNDPGIFDPEKRTTKSAPAQERFDHGSPGHADHACTECHDEGVVDQTERVLDVPWPAFDADACVLCHMKERYHR